MDQSNRPEDVTQGAPPAAPPEAPTSPPEAPYPVPQEPPGIPPLVAYPRPGAEPPGGYPPPATPPPPGGYPPPATPPPWGAPAEPLGPAPGLLFAPHGVRFVAYVVDVVLLSVLAIAVSIALTLVIGALAVFGADVLAIAGVLVLFLALFGVSLGYFPWFWVNGGATPGMRIFNLRVVRDRDGGPIGWGAAILRLIGFWVSSFVFYLGFAWILIDKRRRGWHDLIAGTVMVQPA